VQSVFAEGWPDGACWSGASAEVTPPEISFETGLEPHAAEGSTVDDGNTNEDLTQPGAGDPVLAGYAWCSRLPRSSRLSAAASC